MSNIERCWQTMPEDEADRIEDALIAALDEDDAMTALQVLRELVVPASHYRGAVEERELLRHALLRACGGDQEQVERIIAAERGAPPHLGGRS